MTVLIIGVISHHHNSIDHCVIVYTNEYAGLVGSLAAAGSWTIFGFGVYTYAYSYFSPMVYDDDYFVFDGYVL